MVGRAGFEPATNWLKATTSSCLIFMLLLSFSSSSSPHFRQFHYSFGLVFFSFIAFSEAFVGKVIPASFQGLTSGLPGA